METGEPRDDAESGRGADAALDAAADELRTRRERLGLGRAVRWALVAPLVVLWIVGGIIPIVPGFPFLIVALVLLAPDVPPVHRFVARLQRRAPVVRKLIPRRWRRVERSRP